MIEQSWLQDGIFSGSRIGIFYSGLDRKIWKIPKSLGVRSGFENPEKILRAKSRKSRESGSGFENPEKSRQKATSGGIG